jgi:hypothetical protein
VVRVLSLVPKFQIAPSYTFSIYKSHREYLFQLLCSFEICDLKVSFIKDVIQEKSINLLDKLGNHSNPILQPLLEQQQRRRLKKLWLADLIDG